MSCAETKNSLHLYLDGELAATEALELEAHLVQCAACRKEYEALLAAVETVRASSTLYKASETSRRQAEKIIAGHRRRTAVMRAATAGSVLVILLAAFFVVSQRMAPRDRFAAFAAESHLRYSRGALPLDIQAQEPQQVAGWLSDRLPFHLALPNYPQQPGQSKRYSLVGARLLQMGEDDIAYLAYRMEGRPISLLMTSSARVIPAGGEVYRSGGLSFHTTAYKGLRIITWTDKGLSYALVSDLNAVGAESCVICHGEESEQQKFAPLRPKL